MKAVQHHITSLDVFRGLAVAAMIVVNNPGNWNAVYPPLVHAHWNGFTAADAVFPAFVFIVGTALPFALSRRLLPGETRDRRRVLPHILRRTVVLIALGLLLNLVDVLPHLATLRIPGVLQRIALAYLVSAPLVLFTPPWAWGVAMAALLAGHALLLLAVPFSSPAGTLTPDANPPGAVDAWLFGPAHLLTPRFDPEGLIGTASTAATMVCGALAGAWLRAAQGHGRRVAGLVAGGAALLGLGLSSAAWIPLNKALWTPGFALVSGGTAALAFALCYAMVDWAQRGRWLTPLQWLGSNPLAIYFLSECARHVMDVGWWPHGSGRIGIKDAIFWGYLTPMLGNVSPPAASLVFALGVTLVWVVVAGVLFRRGVRIRI